ncbi:MAG: hypothetical protein J6A01_05100 [Proteobacteria bacterium]|nr:hypothetical protein [Pseudomonadota bacterium]
MKKIKSFSLVSFTNHALVSFCTEVESHVKASLPVENAALCDDFSASLSAFKDILASSVETFNEAILEADKKADGAWSAINTLLNLNVNHYDDAVCEAARTVLDVFDNISNPTRLPYAEEYARLESLLTQLSAIPAETLKTAMVDGWIDELRRRVDAFNELRKTKTQTRSEIETGASKKARQALTDAYRDLVDTLNAMQLLSKSEAFDLIAQHLNELIDANRAAMKAKKTAKKGGKENDGTPVEAEV